MELLRPLPRKWVSLRLTKFNGCGVTSQTGIRLATPPSKLPNPRKRVDILINDAACGIMTRQLAANGVGLHIAINHTGHIVLISHLPLMKKTTDKESIV